MRRKVLKWTPKRWDAEELECGHVWSGDADDGYVSTEDKDWYEAKGGVECWSCNPPITVQDKIRNLEKQLADLKATLPESDPHE